MGDNEDNQFEEEEDEAPTINFKPSFVLIAIDTHPSMFVVREDEYGYATHPFKDAVTACYEIADKLILCTSRSNYNQFGIVLAHEDEKANLIEVENNLLDTIKTLQELSNKSNEELQTTYERSSDFDLSSFLLLCKKKFKDIKSAYYKRTLIYLTTDDDPVKGDAQKKFAALHEGKTFEPMDITLEIITMKSNFDYTKFYNELFHQYSTPPTADIYCPDKYGVVVQLKKSIVFRYARVKYKFYPFKNDYSRSLNVVKVNFLREAKIISSHRASVDGKIVIPIKQDPKDVVQDLPEYALPIDRGEYMKFSMEDKNNIMQINNLPNGFHLQYISDRIGYFGVVLDKMSLMLLDPKEELNKYFEQLWQYCADKNKVLVCIKKYRNLQDLRYAEFIPKFANNQKLFLIKDIPFKEEYKFPREIYISQRRTTQPTLDQIHAINLLIESLTMDYEPTKLFNPSYNKKRAFIKSRLLGLPEESVEDPTADIEEMINTDIARAVSIIEKEFGISGQPQGEKRKGKSSGGQKRAKHC